MTFLTPKEISERLAISVDTVLRWIHSGQLKASDVSRTASGRPQWRINATDLDEFLKLRVAPNVSESRKRRRKTPEKVIRFYE